MFFCCCCCLFCFWAFTVICCCHLTVFTVNISDVFFFNSVVLWVFPFTPFQQTCSTTALWKWTNGATEITIKVQKGGNKTTTNVAYTKLHRNKSNRQRSHKKCVGSLCISKKTLWTIAITLFLVTDCFCEEQYQMLLLTYRESYLIKKQIKT